MSSVLLIISLLYLGRNFVLEVLSFKQLRSIYVHDVWTLSSFKSLGSSTVTLVLEYSSF